MNLGTATNVPLIVSGDINTRACFEVY